MPTELSDPGLDLAIADACSALAGLGKVGFAGMTPGADASAAIAKLEGLNARVHSLLLAAQAEVDRRGLYAQDGHASAKVLVRHAARLSGPEASRRAKAVRALREMPALRCAHAVGRVGVAQVDRVARVWANPRVREQVVAHDELFVELAESLSYADFDAVLTDWERLADADGAGDRARRAHEQRTASIGDDFDGTFHLRASCGGLQGAELREIHRHYVDAEFRADWAEARERLGDAATVDDLARTDAQRHMDALHQIFLDAAASRAAAPGGSTIETGVVIDHTTFEREAAKLAGHDPGPDPRQGEHLANAARAARRASASGAASEPVAGPEPEGSDRATEAAPGDRFRCSTIDGTPLDPTEVVAQALIGHVRRVVLGADSVTIDLGRRSRLFTGPAALAARLGNTTCYWPGCHVPAGQCQIDHLEPWSSPGQPSTNPGNGGPACGKHNRYKEHGFTVWRDPMGRWHTYRPDGTEI